MARITIRAHPNAKKNAVKVEGRTVNIWITAPARDGRANRAIVELLARVLGIKKSQVRIIRGEKSREKIIEVPDDAASRLFGQTA